MWERANKMVCLYKWCDRLYKNQKNKQSNKKFLEQISDYKKITAYRSNISKSIVFNEQIKFEIKDTKWNT